MTQRIGPVTIIAAEAPQQCDLCGQIRELRPYGPGGVVCCFHCATATPEHEAEMEHRAGHHMFGQCADAPQPCRYGIEGGS